MVIRNAGGRVSPDVLADLAYIGYLSGTLNPAGPGFEVAVIHHTQCGTHFLADADFRHGFAELIKGDDAALAAQAVVHPEQTVRLDVDRLRSSAILPPTITVSGHVYDVDTGLITTVIPAAPCTRPGNTRHHGGQPNMSSRVGWAARTSLAAWPTPSSCISLCLAASPALVASRCGFEPIAPAVNAGTADHGHRPLLVEIEVSRGISDNETDRDAALSRSPAVSC